MAAVIRVLIADDHLIFRMGLKSLLNNEPDIAVVGEAMTGAQTIEKFRALRPDVVVLDLRMPDGGGMLALAGVREARSDAKVLVLSSYASEEEVYQALQAGASGYVLKDVGRDELTGAIRQVYAGREWIQPCIQPILASREDRHELTPRELEVLKLLVRGLTNREIAKVLGNSENTVRNHTIRIFAKLYVSDRAEAVSAALQRGIVVPNS
ncbi:MAG: DNA-binding response regulator [Acidobacteria bacterium]|nr:MAG: DNA-binding response regulator [Acidobacteriota bacterium]PYY05426.1 MAG: DNA-binding response regulator [Acidobacteriota bacterium]